MITYTVRRIIWAIPVLWAVATITFLLMHAVPGGPFTDDKTRPAAVLEAQERRYHFNEPLYKQYGYYLKNLVRGDLGISTQGDREVTDNIRRTWFVTAQLGLMAFLLAAIVGLVLGTLSALNHNGPLDYVGVGFATIFASVPNFILGSFLALFFAVNIQIFKLSGWGGPLRPSDIFDFSVYDWRYVVLPVVSLAALPASYIARVTRASVLEVMSQDYIRTARAKGMQERVVVVRHTIKNALIPVLTVMGPQAAILIGGSFIIETMFTIPGLGHETISAVVARDYNTIMGTALVFALVVVVASLVVDLAYALVDPRIRYS